MLHPMITKEALRFLDQLKRNNNRDWFSEKKEEYQKHRQQVKGFFTLVRERLEVNDKIEKLKMFRIYRDVRFSKDKTPYQPHFSAAFIRQGAERKGTYYIRVKPGETLIGGGFWGPEKQDLFRIRKEFETDASELRDVIGNIEFQQVWGELQGDAVKTAPKGFDKTHPNIDLIRRKQFLFKRDFKDGEVLSVDFLDEIDRSFKVIRPYFDLMSDILTTNLNGESVLR